MQITSRDIKNIEQELRFEVDDIDDALQKLNSFATFQGVEYILDTIYGSENQKEKIRYRISNTFSQRLIEVTSKNKVENENKNSKIKTEIEEILYKGDDENHAISAINEKGNYKKENSYEKIRINYSYKNNLKISLDIYPFGAYLEIEGDPADFQEVVGLLGMSVENSTTSNADQCYLKWNSKMNLKELWHVRFGLTDKYETKQ
ncbi:MAG: hypothetical protein NZM26_03025 [Patescibacteria group bacterium]|nr:hypothetical protein [Patescibacteria group bacterium]